MPAALPKGLRLGNCVKTVDFTHKRHQIRHMRNASFEPGLR